MSEVIICSWEGCDQPAAEALVIRGQAGHVHDCRAHSAVLREWCDVQRSAEIAQGVCPFPCSAAPIHVSTPTPLGGDA